MKTTLISLLVAAALGAVGGVYVYKRLNPAKPCPAAEETKATTETRTIIRYRDSKGQPIEKETTVSQKTEKRNEPLPVSRPKNIFGIAGRLTPKGEVKVGPTYGRELFPNTYITGGILATPQGKDPEAHIGLQIHF